MAGGHLQKTVHEQHSEKYLINAIMHGGISSSENTVLVTGFNTVICDFVFLQIPVTF
jgi:hypothetical protein